MLGINIPFFQLVLLRCASVIRIIGTTPDCLSCLVAIFPQNLKQFRTHSKLLALFNNA